MIGMAILVGCGSNDAAVTGAPAVWSTADRLTPSSTAFAADVLRLECSGGRTGDVPPPKLKWSDSQLTVTFSAAPLAPGALRCPLNDRVPYVVTLDRPIGNRDLVDGACASVAKGFDYCADGGFRWRTD